MAVELAHAYISIIPETSKIAPGVYKALGGVEKSAEKSGKGMGGKIAAGMGGALKKSAIGVGAVAGAALGAGLTKGIGRLNSIEQAEAKLKGLGHSAQAVGGIMENSLAAVKGTAFGLEEAASSAAGLVAAGIKPGKELEQVLKTVGDTATIAGTNMQDMGTIFGSVAARGKLQGDDMLQLLSRGVPVLQLLAEETGKTSAEISDMVSKGQIDFATFERAMRRGMGGAALEAGKTVQGAFKNMGAAAGRLGATLAGPFFKQAAGGLNAVTSALDAMDAGMKPVMANMDKWMTGTAVPAFKEFGTAAKVAFSEFKNSGVVLRTADVFKSLGQTAVDLFPSLLNIGEAVAKATSALGLSTWNVFLTTLEAVGLAAKIVAPPLEAISGFMADHPSLVLAAVAAWAGFKTVPDLVKKIPQPVRDAASAMKEMGTSAAAFAKAHPEMSKTSIAAKMLGANAPSIDKLNTAMSNMANSSNKTLQAMGQGYVKASAGLMQVSAAHKQAAAAAKANALASTSAFAAIDSMGAQMGHSFIASTAKMGAAAKGLVAGGLNVLKSGFSGLMGALGGPWGLAITGAMVALSGYREMSAKAEEANRKLAAQSRDVAAAQGEMKAAVAGTTGALSDQGLAAATKLANAELQDFVAIGEQYSGVWGKISLGFANMSGDIQAAATSDAYDLLKGQLNSLGYSMDDLGSIVANGGPEYDNLIAKLRASGDAGNDAANELEKTRTAIQNSIDKAREMGPAGATLAAALKDIADKAGDAGDRANKLNRAFMELAGIELSAAEANANLTEVIDSVTSQMGELAGATLDASGAFDTTTTSGAAAHDAIMNIGDAMRDAVGAGEPAADVFARTEASLRQVAQQAGMTDAEYQAMLETYRLTPELLETTVAVSDDVAKAELAAIQAEFSKFDGEPITKTIQVSSQQAVDELNKVGIKVTEFDKATGTAKATVDDQEALNKLNNLIQSKLPELSAQKATAHAVLDASGLFATKEFAAAQLYTLDLARPTPLANMDISQLNAKHIQALQEVGLLDGQTPTPDAYMNIDQLTGAQQAALAQIFDLDSQRPTPLANLSKEQLDAKAADANARLQKLHNTKTEPKVIANTSQAISKLGGVKSLLSSLKDKIVNVFVNRHDSGGGRADGGRFASGGKLPAYAKGDRHDGYRLPNTGPGSNGTDKWLALDQYNQPVARLDHGEWIINRRSSAKYDKELAAINAGTFPKLPGYADGGVFDDITSGKSLRTAQDFLRFARGEMVDGVQASRSLEGAPYVWGGSNWGDCSGTASAFSAFAVGIDPFPRKFATGSEESWLRNAGFNMGNGPEGSFRVGWFNGGPYGGHTSATLPDGTNVEMGGGRGNGQIGGQAAGADHPQYTHRAWFPAASASESPESASESPDSAVTDGEISASSGGDSVSVPSTTTGGDDNLVPLSTEGAAAAETLHNSDSGPGLLGGASTWSDFGGSVVAAAVSGQIADVLGVLGIPDELPPVVKAGQQWFQAAKEANQKTAGFINAEKDLIKAANAVDEAQATGAVDADEAVKAAGGSTADAVLETAEKPAVPAPDWGPEYFASEIARAAKDMGLSKKAAEIGVATALVESGDPMRMWANNAVPESLNYRHDAIGSDHDSVGLFQQRDNGAWGTVAQRMNPYDSAKMFFTELMKLDWESMDPGAAAQAVQRSAFPDRYATKMQRAKELLASIPAFKNGGLVTGGKGKKLDDVLAFLSKGEMVINSDAVDADPKMAKTLNEQGPEAVKAQVLAEQPTPEAAKVEPVPIVNQAALPNISEQPKAVETFNIDPGAIQETINGALPMLMEQTSWADAAKLVTSSAVSFAGNMATSAASGAVDMVAEAGMSALGMAGAPTLGAMVGAATAPVTGALGPAAGAMAGTAAAPFGSLLGQVMPLTPGDMVGAAGGVMTDAAAWYAGEVAWGVTNAFEQYSKDLFGQVLLPFQDVMGVLKTPVVGDLAATAGINIPGAASFRDYIPEPLQKSVPTGGDVYNFIAQSREGMYSDFRREMAKNNKGVVGAR